MELFVAAVLALVLSLEMRWKGSASLWSMPPVCFGRLVPGADLPQISPAVSL